MAMARGGGEGVADPRAQGLVLPHAYSTCTYTREVGSDSMTPVLTHSTARLVANGLV